MSNSRSHQERRRVRARARAKDRQSKPRFPDAPPALGTVRRWLKQAEAQGLVERAGVEHTGKPGRPAHLWQAGREGGE
jgi:DNA-binding PadR family transcriptional regulator